jgi:hypothetical protein
MTALTLGPIARPADITRCPGAAEGASMSPATGIAVRSATRSNSISRINGDIAQLPGAERAQVDQTVAVIRKHRAVNLGMAAFRAAAPSPANKALT